LKRDLIGTLEVACIGKTRNLKCEEMDGGIFLIGRLATDWTTGTLPDLW
jgi:hypothetical protein